MQWFDRRNHLVIVGLNNYPGTEAAATQRQCLSTAFLFDLHEGKRLTIVHLGTPPNCTFEQLSMNVPARATAKVISTFKAVSKINVQKHEKYLMFRVQKLTFTLLESDVFSFSPADELTALRRDPTTHRAFHASTQISHEHVVLYLLYLWH